MKCEFLRAFACNLLAMKSRIKKQGERCHSSCLVVTAAVNDLKLGGTSWYTTKVATFGPSVAPPLLFAKCSAPSFESIHSLFSCPADRRSANPIDLLSILLTLNGRKKFARIANQFSQRAFVCVAASRSQALCPASDSAVPPRRQELPYRHHVRRCDPHQQHVIVCGSSLMSSTFFCGYILYRG